MDNMKQFSMEEIGLAYCVITLFAEVMYLLPGPQERRLNEFIENIKSHYPDDITENQPLSDEAWNTMFGDGDYE